VNSLWNLIILAIAIIIPGGLIAYIAWKTYKKHKDHRTYLRALKDFKALYPLKHERYAPTEAKLRE
jgi:hypothetical protein